MMASSDMRRMRASVGTVPSMVLAARSRRARALVVGEAGGAELLVGAVEEVLGGRGGRDRCGAQMGWKHSSRRRWMVAAALPCNCW